MHWIRNTHYSQRNLFWLVLVVLSVSLLAACGADDEPSASAATRTVAAIPTPQPTLDIEAIPMLGVDEPVPPVPLAVTDARYPISPAEGAVYTEGQALYNQFCASCHGVEGEGELPEPLAPGAAPPHDADGHTWHHADQQNFATVWYGRSAVGVMPGYYDRMTPDEIIQVLAYIKTWWLADQLEHQMELSQKVAEQ